MILLFETVLINIRWVCLARIKGIFNLFFFKLIKEKINIRSKSIFLNVSSIDQLILEEGHIQWVNTARQIRCQILKI